MKSVVHSEFGGPEVLRLVDRPDPTPGPGEVLVRVAVSGVNPTDWKARVAAPRSGAEFDRSVPNQDGAGTIEAVGEGVDPARVGERVWLWEAAWKRAEGTAQELLTIPSAQAVRLPEGASFDLGASLGIPALTAHRCLTVAEGGPTSLAPGALAGRTVLVSGGAGAVGHAAIELARWAGATVLTTVSSPAKATLALAAGADHVINYRTDDVAAVVRRLAPNGVDLIVEVDPGANAQLARDVLAVGGTVAAYAFAEENVTVPAWPAMFGNWRYQFVLVYTVPPAAKEQAVADVSAAVEANALRVGEAAGLPLHRYPLAATGDAHTAVQQGAVGKVLIDI